MANTLYPAAREAFLGGDLAWDTGDIRVILVDLADYTYSDTHDFLNDVPSAARVAVSASLTGKTQTGGIADADDVTFAAVTGDQAEALIIYDHTGGGDSARRLIAYFDTFASGMPVTPNGGDITIAWDNGANKIFKL